MGWGWWVRRSFWGLEAPGCIVLGRRISTGFHGGDSGKAVILVIMASILLRRGRVWMLFKHLLRVTKIGDVLFQTYKALLSSTCLEDPRILCLEMLGVIVYNVSIIYARHLKALAMSLLEKVGTGTTTSRPHHHKIHSRDFILPQRFVSTFEIA